MPFKHVQVRLGTVTYFLSPTWKVHVWYLDCRIQVEFSWLVFLRESKFPSLNFTKIICKSLPCEKNLLSKKKFYLYLYIGSELMIIETMTFETYDLLFSDMLSQEPPWSEGEICIECGVKFSIKTRKHHW